MGRGDHKKLKEGEAALNRWFGKYKRRAQKNNIEFSLSKEEFQNLIIQDCTYCGDPPVERCTSESCINGTIKANGLDRSDNKLGYTTTNAIPCCSVCNRFKLDYTKEEFLNHMKRISENHPCTL